MMLQDMMVDLKNKCEIVNWVVCIVMDFMVCMLDGIDWMVVLYLDESYVYIYIFVINMFDLKFDVNKLYVGKCVVVWWCICNDSDVIVLLLKLELMVCFLKLKKECFSKNCQIQVKCDVCYVEVVVVWEEFCVLIDVENIDCML